MTIQTSVIIPVYNESKTIPNSIEALESQTFPHSNFEILFIDNGSTDGSYSKLNRTASKSNLNIKALRHPIGGSYSARNRGIKESNGEVLAFIDGDCIPHNKWIERGFSRVKKTKGILAGKISLVFNHDPPGLWEFISAARNYRQELYTSESGLTSFAATGNLFVHKKIFEKYGTFTEELKSGGDAEFGNRITSKGGSIDYSEDLIVYHPLRTTFTGTLGKVIRLSRGEVETRKLIDRSFREYNWRMLVPDLNVPEIQGENLPAYKKPLYILFNNFFSYVVHLHQFYWKILNFFN